MFWSKHSSTSSLLLIDPNFDRQHFHNEPPSIFVKLMIDDVIVGYDDNFKLRFSRIFYGIAVDTFVIYF